MDIKELIKEKSILYEKIRSMIEEFETRCKVSISNITYETEEIIGHDEQGDLKNCYIPGKLSIEIKI
jgi:hypothetical protein